MRPKSPARPARSTPGIPRTTSLAAIDVPGFVADLKDHAVDHGFHVHDERHFVETYSLRQAWEVDLHPEEACDGPLHLHLSLEVDPRVLLSFEDTVMGLDEDEDPPDSFQFPLLFNWTLPPLHHLPDLLVLATELAGVGGPDLPARGLRHRLHRLGHRGAGADDHGHGPGRGLPGQDVHRPAAALRGAGALQGGVPLRARTGPLLARRRLTRSRNRAPRPAARTVQREARSSAARSGLSAATWSWRGSSTQMLPGGSATAAPAESRSTNGSLPEPRCQVTSAIVPSGRSTTPAPSPTDWASGDDASAELE